jgi:flagellar biosynthesis protein FlhB
MVIYGIMDYIWSVHRHIEQNKMTKQEVKEERKQSEGDMQVKQRIRQKQRELAQRSMMGDVPEADVVVTNPTHFAVALKYVKGETSAPKVVAKGRNLIAQKIKEIARESNVPIIEDKPTAQALFFNVELEQEIPDNLFKAVATILAKAYKMRGKRA